MSFTFFLGTHEPLWLRRTTVPLFISARRLRRLGRLPRAACHWALDSGGFSELSMYGAWQTSAKAYVEEVRRWRDFIGNLVWASAQDWMCEPWMLTKTGKTVHQHQRLTVDNFLELRALAPDLPWLPVLQGWTVADYMRCAELYSKEGIQLEHAPVVGLGSFCRRQATTEAEQVVQRCMTLGYRLHAFGFKTRGLRACMGSLASSDSMAWSFRARKRPTMLPTCTHKHCSNCFDYAHWWRNDLLAKLKLPA